MGTYIYFLTTKSRMVEIDGEKKPVYLLAYAYKDGWGGMPKVARMTEGRLEAAWSRRAAYPEYVTTDFSKGSPIYRWGGRCGIAINDGAFAGGGLPCVGKLSAKGSRLLGEIWKELIIEGRENYADLWAMLRERGIVVHAAHSTYNAVHMFFNSRAEANHAKSLLGVPR